MQREHGSDSSRWGARNGSTARNLAAPRWAIQGLCNESSRSAEAPNHRIGSAGHRGTISRVYPEDEAPRAGTRRKHSRNDRPAALDPQTHPPRPGLACGTLAAYGPDAGVAPGDLTCWRTWAQSNTATTPRTPSCSNARTTCAGAASPRRRRRRSGAPLAYPVVRPDRAEERRYEEGLRRLRGGLSDGGALSRTMPWWPSCARRMRSQPIRWARPARLTKRRLLRDQKTDICQQSRRARVDLKNPLFAGTKSSSISIAPAPGSFAASR